MPKTTSLLFYKKPLNPTTEIFPLRFKELLPLKLRNEVTYKAAAGQDARKCAVSSKLYGNHFVLDLKWKSDIVRLFSSGEMPSRDDGDVRVLQEKRV